MAQLVDLNGLNKVYKTNKGRIDKEISDRVSADKTLQSTLQSNIDTIYKKDDTTESGVVVDKERAIKEELSSGEFIVKNSEYSSKIGSSSIHPQVGSTSTPVYVNSNGEISCITDSSIMTLGESKVTDIYMGVNIPSDTPNASVHSKSLVLSAPGYSNRASITFDGSFNGGAIVFDFI